MSLKVTMNMINQLNFFFVLFSQEDADLVEFPEIPELVDIPEPEEGDAVPYSEYEIPEDIKQRLDNFLLKREDWKRRWENLPEEKQEAFRKYIDEKLKE